MANETSPTLGEYLRSEREKREITIEQVASATKVGVRTLVLLESDQYAELPVRPFVLGFVRSYSRFIGLDPNDVLIRYGDFIARKAHDRPSRDAGHSGYAFEKREGESSRTALWMVMGGFLVAGGIAAIFVKKPLGHRHQNAHLEKLRQTYGAAPHPGVLTSPIASPSGVPSLLPPPTSPIVPVPAPTVAPAPTSLATPAPLVTASPVVQKISTEIPLLLRPPVEQAVVPDSVEKEDAEDDGKPDPLNSGVNLSSIEIKHRVIFRAAESVWIRYQVDDRKRMTFPLLEGKTLVLRAQTQIRFQVSNPKAITYSYRGGGFKPLLGDQHLVTKQGDATIYFPYEMAENEAEPFPGDSRLTGRPTPIARKGPSGVPKTE